MRRLLLLLFVFVVSFSAQSQTNHLVISQVYGGGGNSGALYTNDFVELFNPTNVTVSLNGLSIQYASAAGTSWTNKVDLNGSIAPGGFFLIQLAGGATGVALPTPDQTGGVNMSATAGKVALVNSTTALTGSGCPFPASVIDFVGFGTTATCSEGATAPAPSNTNSIRRTNLCFDTDNNGADFTAGTPLPRNSASPLNPCAVSPLPVLSINNVRANEGNSGTTTFTFTVSLSSPAPAGGVTFDIATANGTATAGSDYVAKSLTGQTIAAGSTSYIVVVTINGDTEIEADETFFINVSNVTGASLADGQGEGTITNDDVVQLAFIELGTSVYAENFNTLAVSGTSSATPHGWHFAESGTTADATYATGTGSGNGGNTYSFGTAGSTERAFGGLQSGSLVPTIGTQFKNNTGTAITSLKIVYTGEQWRLGATGRLDRLDFQYSLNATSLTSGAWTDVDQLDFVAPTEDGTTGALDGNAAANRSAVTFVITGLDVPAGSTFFIRWADFNASGSDDGLAIDDFSIQANLVDNNAPVLTNTFPTAGAADVATTFVATLTFDETVKKGTGNILIKKSDNTLLQTIPVANVTLSGETASFTVNGLPIGTGITVEIEPGTFRDFFGNGFAGSSWSFTTGTVFYTANFQNCTSSLSDGFTQFSETGSVVWGCTPFGRDPNAPSSTAQYPSGVQINGFVSGANQVNTDWLISPSFNLTNTAYPLLSFWSRTAFTGPALQLKVSTDYTGGDPRNATWTTLNGRFPAQASNSWTLSENINLSAFTGSNVHIAFVYTSTSDDGARWTLDDISLSNSPTPPPPTMTVGTNDVVFTYVASGSSAVKPISFTGNDLAGDVTLTATGAFSLSRDGTSFAPSLSFTQAEANDKAQVVYVRFTPNEEGRVFNGTVSLSTTGAEAAAISLKGTSIDPATTLEVVNWNVEWFGHTGNGPSNEDLQQQNVKTILSNVGADIYALAEVVDENRLAAVVSQMPGYTYVISDFGSHTNTSLNPVTALATAQKLAFVYKTDVFSNVSTTALLSSGINTAADAASDAYYWWSSGRYPYMLSADVTLNGITKPMKFVLVHAKANTNPTNESYDRRKKGADALYALLQEQYPEDNIVVLGDFNDDLDVSITSGFTTTSWNKFTEDNANFEELTLPLSEAGRKSTVSYNDMIDHVVISNDLKPYYMASTASVLSDVSSMVANYGSTTSDHYPIFTRYMFCTITPPANITVANEAGKCGAVVNYDISAAMTCGTVTSSFPSGSFFPVGRTTVTLTASSGETATFTVTVEDKEAPAITRLTFPVQCYDESENYTVPALTATDNCSINTISYAITGATTRNGSGTDVSGTFHIGVSTIAWTVTDVHGNEATYATTVQVNKVQSSIPDVYAVPGGAANTIYTGYGPASVTLQGDASGGVAPYSFAWTAAQNLGSHTSASYTVSPTSSTTYYLTIKDGNNCSAAVTEKTVYVVDVRCGPKMNKVAMCSPSGNSMICVAKQAVANLLAAGAKLGSCTPAVTTRTVRQDTEAATAFRLTGSPNPSAGAFNLQVASNLQTPVQLRVTDLLGRTVELINNVVPNSNLQIGAAYKAGVYLVEVVQGDVRRQVKLIKQ